jgi:hypothetical protein
MIQVVIKCDKKVFVFEGISRTAQCSDLLSHLGALLGPGVKIPGNASLMENGLYIEMHKSIEEVSLNRVII